MSAADGDDDPGLIEDLAALEEFVVHNDELLELEAEIGKFNIFDALKITRAEIRHSNFLAFLLDPAEAHGQGQLFLKAILMDLFRKTAPALRPFSPIELDGIDLRGVEVRREWKHIDLLVTCKEPSFVLAIENKVDSREGLDQLSKYEKAVNEQFPIEKKLFVFLTRRSEHASNPKWVPYRYNDIHSVLLKVRNANKTLIGDDVLVFLDHYLSLIGTRFMTNEKLDELCQRIYKTHRRALDLIFDRAGSIGSGILAAAETALKEDPRWHVFNFFDRRIFFVPKSWIEWLPPVGLDDKENPQAWIVFRFYVYSEMLEFVIQVRKTSNQSKRNEIVKKLISELPKFGFKPSKASLKNENSPRTRVTGSDAVLKWSEEEEPEFEIVGVAVKKKLDEIYSKLDQVPTILKDLLTIG